MRIDLEIISDMKKEHIVHTIPKAVITYFSLSYTPANITEAEGPILLRMLMNFISSFRGFSIEHLALFICLVIIYPIIKDKWTKNENGRTVTVLSLLFSAFMVLGHSFSCIDSWDLVFRLTNGQFFIASLVAIGYFFLFQYALHSIFFWIDSIYLRSGRTNIKERSFINLYRQYLAKHPFHSIFIILVIAFIPYFVISYPSIFMGDTRTQIRQAFSELKIAMGYMSPKYLLSDEVYINQHHPVAHTLLMHCCILLGDALMQSFNAGIFMYSLLQSIIFLAALAYSISFLLREGIITYSYSFFAVIYCVIHPLLRNYMFLATKDTIYAASFTLLILFLFGILLGKQGKSAIIGIILSGTGMLLFRNESRYILLLSFLLISIVNKTNRKIALVLLGYFTLFTGLMFYVLFPILKFSPGSKREMLSVPFQQTARYVSFHADEVTEEEKDAINRVLNYDKLVENYNPDLSDDVKATYKEEASKNDLFNYFRIWGKMFLKHPGTYIQATMNNYYQYFYPGDVRFLRFTYSWSETCFENTNKDIELLGKQFSYPKSTMKIRQFSDTFYDKLSSFPLISLMMTPASYNWLLIIMFAYGIKNRQRRSTVCVLLVIPILVMLICILGPCNGYYGRYSYPIVVLMPLLIPMYLNIISRDFQIAKNNIETKQSIG